MLCSPLFCIKGENFPPSSVSGRPLSPHPAKCVGKQRPRRAFTLFPALQNPDGRHLVSTREEIIAKWAACFWAYRAWNSIRQHGNTPKCCCPEQIAAAPSKVRLKESLKIRGTRGQSEFKNANHPVLTTRSRAIFTNKRPYWLNIGAKTLHYSATYETHFRALK